MLSTAKFLLAATGLVGATAICGICVRGIASDTRSVGAAVAGDTATVKLAIRGMTCGSCATTARVALQRVEGIYRADVSYESKSGVVSYDPARTSPESFIAHLKKLTGYEATVVPESRSPEAGR